MAALITSLESQFALARAGQPAGLLCGSVTAPPVVTFAPSVVSPEIPSHLLVANPPNYQLGCPAGYLGAVTQPITEMPPIVPSMPHKGATMAFQKGATRELTGCDDGLALDSGCNETVTGFPEDFMLPTVGSDDSGMDYALMSLFNHFNLNY